MCKCTNEHDEFLDWFRSVGLMDKHTFMGKLIYFCDDSFMEKVIRMGDIKTLKWLKEREEKRFEKGDK